jgi:hypothetical protein
MTTEILPDIAFPLTFFAPRAAFSLPHAVSSTLLFAIPMSLP